MKDLPEPIGEVYRAVGGFSQRSELIEYDIIIYTLLHETPRYYTTLRNGKVQIQNKRVTSNSQFFTDRKKALDFICDRIYTAIKSITKSLSDIERLPRSELTQLHFIKFRPEGFEYIAYRIVRQTKRAVQIDTGQTRLVERTRRRKVAKGKYVRETYQKKVYVGKSYIYPHEPQEHNPAHPYEHWTSTELDKILSAARYYGEKRVRYLNDTRTGLIEWAELADRIES